MNFKKIAILALCVGLASTLWAGNTTPNQPTNPTTTSFGGWIEGTSEPAATQPVSTSPRFLSEEYWRTDGNSDIEDSVHFLGTLEDAALEFRVDNMRVMRYEPYSNGTNSIVGGYYMNSIGPNSQGSVIGGGGWNMLFWGPNTIKNSAQFSVIGGGDSHLITGAHSVIGGGSVNKAAGMYSVVGGGYYNETTGKWTIVSGGRSNRANAYFSVVSGGDGNVSNSDYSTVAGGIDNNANAVRAVISGGGGNKVTGVGAVIAGGSDNTTDGSFSFAVGRKNKTVGDYSTIPGGKFNYTEGVYSFAVGLQDSVFGDYSSVCGGLDNTVDSTYSAIVSGDSNTLYGSNSVICSGHGIGLTGNYSVIAGGADNLIGPGLSDYCVIGGGIDNVSDGYASTVPGGKDNKASAQYTFASGRQAKAIHSGCFVWGDGIGMNITSTGSNQFMARAIGGVYFYTSASLMTGAFLAPGSGSWSSVSDRNVKENFSPVDGDEILAKVAALPISSWNYKSQDPEIRHIGPMAQDFHAAFGVGDDDKHLTTVDVDGVALACIKALHDENQDLKAQVENLTERLEAIEKEIR